MAALGRAQRIAPARAEDPEQRVARVVAEHGRTLLRVAHQWSLCHDDALDAFQRGLEIFFRRLDRVDPATEVAWLKVVIKNEALAIRRGRSDSIAREDVELDTFIPAPQRAVEELIVSGERVRHSAEALRALKPDEARALMLKAEGLSYDEIAERCGWTYTKVNRSITEGRRRFMKVYEGIESGAECERHAPTLAALADGTATSAEVIDIRPHLRHCTACRATVRELHLSRLRRMALFTPLPALVWPLHWLEQRLGGGAAAPPEPGPVLEGPDGTLVIPGLEPLQAPDLPAAPPDLPATSPDLPEPDVWASPGLGPQLTLDPSLTATETLEQLERTRNIRDGFWDLVHRLNGSDLATTGAQVAAGSGGGRIATAAAVLGLCLGGAGAATVCVVTGVVPNPGVFGREEAKPPRERPRAEQPTRTYEREVRPALPTPTPAPVARVAERKRPAKSRPSASVDKSQGTTPTSHENAPISPPATGSTQDFSFEQQAPSGPSTPAAAPATGGGEFTP